MKPSFTIIFTTLAAAVSAAVHNETAVLSGPGITYDPASAWGPFESLVPLVGCPAGTIVQSASATSTGNPSVSYAFTGSAVYIQLVTGPIACTGTLTLDGADTQFTTTPAQALGCTVVAGKSGLDASAQHTAKVAVTQDGCPFLFAGFIVTLDGAPSSGSTSSSTTPAGSSSTSAPGSTLTIISTTSSPPSASSSAPTVTDSPSATPTGAASHAAARSSAVLLAAVLLLAMA